MILVMLQFGAYREVLGCEGADPASEYDASIEDTLMYIKHFQHLITENYP